MDNDDVQYDGVKHIELQPGFRRRFLIQPSDDRVEVAVEDDFHHMSVVLSHDHQRITGIEPLMVRTPWDTCPGAQQKLRETFIGQSLSKIDKDAALKGEKRRNCTHLYDLVQLGVAHRSDQQSLQYDILVSDPDAQTGISAAQIQRNGQELFTWIVKGFVVQQPQAVEGQRLDQLTGWIMGLPERQQEPALLLRWATMIAHGRSIPLEQQSDASKMPPNCYTFQPLRAESAVRVGKIIDFSRGHQRLLS